ncbi:MAG: hypothetical protein IJB81_01165 [Clostridia bacterium]|nr:hypothetical protein [Clostridia bacterium]
MGLDSLALDGLAVTHRAAVPTGAAETRAISGSIPTKAWLVPKFTLAISTKHRLSLAICRLIPTFGAFFAIKAGAIPTEGRLLPAECGFAATSIGFTLATRTSFPTKGGFAAKFPFTVSTKGGFPFAIFAAAPTGLVVIHISHC